LKVGGRLKDDTPAHLLSNRSLVKVGAVVSTARHTLASLSSYTLFQTRLIYLESPPHAVDPVICFLRAKALDGQLYDFVLLWDQVVGSVGTNAVSPRSSISFFSNRICRLCMGCYPTSTRASYILLRSCTSRLEASSSYAAMAA
jgi:hypothetical protein